MALRSILTSKPVVIGVGVVIVVAVLIAYVLPRVLTKPLSTQVVATLPDGSQKVVYDDSAGPLGLIQIGGQTVTGVKWKTTFTGSSPNYPTYKILGLPSGSSNCGQQTTPNTITCESFNIFILTAPTASLVCQAYLALSSVQFNAVPASFTNTLNSGQSYSLGALAYGNGDGTVLQVSATSLLNWISNGGCPIPGTYTLVYRIQVMIQAIGTGTVPTARYGEWVNTTVTAALGSITISGSSTSTGYSVPLAISREDP